MHYSYEHMREKTLSKQGYNMEHVDALVESGSKMYNEIEFASMMENLEILDNWCKQNNESTFFAYFEDTLIGAYYRYRRTKEKVWPSKVGEGPKGTENKQTKTDWWGIIKESVMTMVPTVSVSGLFAAITAVVSYVGSETFDLDFTLKAGLFGAVIAIPCVAWNLYNRVAEIKVSRELEMEKNRNDREKAIEEKRNYYETWVRHTLCHSRLTIALSKFVVSRRLRADYEELVNSTFAILDQNLDQFALNMNDNGLAERSGDNP